MILINTYGQLMTKKRYTKKKKSFKDSDFIKLDIEEQKKLFKSGKVSFSSQKSKSIKPKLYEINNY